MERYRFSDQERSVMESMKVPFAVYQLIDQSIATLVVSDGFCALAGSDDRARVYAAMDHDTYRNVHPDDVARLGNAVFRFMKEGGRFESVYRLKRQGASEYHIVHAYGEHVYTDTGVRLAQFWYADEGVFSAEAGRGGTELSQSLNNALHEESILRASYYDYLTGLPSMTYFFELAEAGKAAIRAAGDNPTLLYMDFSGMKFFNTRHGFAEGDNLLRSFARILVRYFGVERCCRIGADHFAVQTEQAGLDDKLREVFAETREMNGGKTLPLHVGVYPRQSENEHTSVACDRARLACAALKGRYGMAVNYYSQDLNDDAEKKQYIIENIDRAIEEKWIQVYFQPIVRALTARVCDVEALARWIDPVKGFMSPADFIPALEDAGAIYKLDLYVLEQILQKMKAQAEMGIFVVPHSINLSRTDFDACDMVEEIRRRVDDAGINRDRITIEITESIIGSDFDFIKAQVERFQSLGFPVWMDDFGSGYSSLDVLQSIKFNLIKFDMSFMRKLDEGDSGKIILTELMKMATSLGVDTVCEGVETEAQVRFLQEIGCSKLQGYYYSKPVPLPVVFERYRAGKQIGCENPEESVYFESIGRLNLYDLAVLSSADERAFQHTFNTLPMCVVEVKDGATRYVRSNQSYRDFVRRFFGVELSDVGSRFIRYNAAFMKNVVKTCCECGQRTFYDEKLADGTVVHSFARRICVNPVTGSVAVAIAILSISEPVEGESYADIARALAADYYNIYVVDLDTERFIEYASVAGGEELAEERHGEDFFEAARCDAMTRIYEADRENFLALFTRENIIRELDRHGVFTATYRLIDTGAPMYASMKLTRVRPGGNRIIMGISIIEAQVRQREAEEKARQKSLIFGRIAALSGKYYALYTVDPDTGRYSEYNVSSDYESLGYDREGDDFFRKGRLDGMEYVYPQDLPFFLEHFTRENILRDIREKGAYRISYRLVINGEPRLINLKAAMVRESDGEKVVVGVTIVDDGE